MSQISATLGLKLGDIAGAVNGLSDQVRTKLAPLRDVNSSFGKLKTSLAPIAPYAKMAFATVAVAASAAAAGAATAMAGVGIGLKKAMDTENLRVSFKVLLGDAQAAAAMVQQLEEFADEAPFEMSSIVTAGKQLLAFGVAAKDVKPNLRDIGDLAAAMDKPLDQVADTFGRLKSGQFGQAFDSLRSMGITRTDLESQGLKFSKSGSFEGDANQALDAVRNIIREKFGGTMKELAQTTSSQLLGLKENAGKLLEEFARPINDQLGPLLERLSGFVKSLIPIARAAGEYVVAAFKVISELFSSGSIGEVALSSLKVAFGESANYLIKALIAGFAAAVMYLGETLKTHISMLSMVTKPDFWKGMGLALMGIAAQFGNKLLEFLARVMDSVKFIPGVGGKLSQAAQQIRSFAQSNQVDSKNITSTGMDLLAPHLDAMRDRQAKTLKSVKSAWDSAMGGEDIFDVSDSKKELAGLVDRVRTLAAPNIAKRNEQLEMSDVAGSGLSSESSSDKDRQRPTASRLAAVSGFGVFTKDPLLSESRRQTNLLETIAKNTEPGKGYKLKGDQVLRFD